MINVLRPLTTNFTRYRTHFTKIQFVFEKDDSNYPGTMSYELDLTQLNDLGEFYVLPNTDVYAGDYLQLHVYGRFFSEGLNDGVNIGVQLFENGSYLALQYNFTCTFNIEKEYFWSKNPIRIPIDLNATSVNIYVEKYFLNGTFEMVASVPIYPDVRDINGNKYVDLNKIMDACLEANAYKDFPKMLDQMEGKYEHSILRFHLAQSEKDAWIQSGVTNFFYCIQGMISKDEFFKKIDPWKLNTGVMSHRPDKLQINIGHSEGALVPFSTINFLDNKGKEILVNDSALGIVNIFVPSNPNEILLKIEHFGTAIFALVSYPGGTKIYFTEQEVIYFRVVNTFEGIDATHFLVDYYTSNWWIHIFYFDTATSMLCIKTFNPNLNLSTTPKEEILTLVKPPIGGELWEWNAVCTLDVNSQGNIAAIVSRVGTYDNYCLNVVLAAELDYEIFGLPQIEPGYPATSIATDSNTGKYYVVANDKIWESDVNALSGWTVLYDASPTQGFVANINVKTLYLRTDKPYPFLGIVGVGEVTIPDLDYTKIQVININDDYYIFLHTTNDDAKVYQINWSNPSTIDNISSFVPGESFEQIVFQTKQKIHFAKNSFNCWFTQLNGNTEWNPMPIALNYKLTQSNAFTQAYSLRLKLVSETPEVIYNYNGKHVHQQRYLWFKTMAGTYEILFINGEADQTYPVKKRESSRYLDIDAERVAGEMFTAFITEADRVMNVSSGFMPKINFDYYIQQFQKCKEYYLMEAGNWKPVLIEIVKAQPVSDTPDLYFIDFKITDSFEQI